MKSFENICTVMTGHVTYWKFSTGMITNPAAQIVHSAIDYYPVVPIAVVLLHLIEAIVLRFLHSEETETKNLSNPQNAATKPSSALGKLISPHPCSRRRLALYRKSHADWFQTVVLRPSTNHKPEHWKHNSMWKTMAKNGLKSGIRTRARNIYIFLIWSVPCVLGFYCTDIKRYFTVGFEWL